jgi:NAD(P)-dependent dehydrogenase (short-subunit alcohol dehydrogenase family)
LDEKERSAVASGVVEKRRIVVTGAASGVGRETALLLRERGSEVIGVDIDAAGLDAVRGAGVETLVCDLTSPNDRARLLDAAGGVTGLVNAAGIIRLTRIDASTQEDWDDTLALNVTALFFVSRDIGALMQPGGAIVNISSVAAKNNAMTEGIAYGASKAAVLALTRGLAHHFAPREIRVNAVLPGPTDTAMQDVVLTRLARIRGITESQIAKTRVAGIPLHRTANPREIASVIEFLLSENASFITGQSIGVDGGLVML